MKKAFKALKAIKDVRNYFLNKHICTSRLVQLNWEKASKDVIKNNPVSEIKLLGFVQVCASFSRQAEYIFGVYFEWIFLLCFSYFHFLI